MIGAVRFPRRKTMHTVIRRYEGVEDTAEVARRAVGEFGPMLSARPGFQGYYVVDAGDGVVGAGMVAAGSVGVGTGVVVDAGDGPVP